MGAQVTSKHEEVSQQIESALELAKMFDEGMMQVEFVQHEMKMAKQNGQFAKDQVIQIRKDIKQQKEQMEMLFSKHPTDNQFVNEKKELEEKLKLKEMKLNSMETAQASLAKGHLQNVSRT